MMRLAAALVLVIGMRAASDAAELAPAAFRLLEPLVWSASVGAPADVGPPPLELRTAAPLRI